MTVTVSGVSAPSLFRESLYKMRVYGDREESRNGPVYSIAQPVVLNLWNPTKRVITDPTRNANPFFHVMEFVWMMAGSYDARWISQFNKNMMSFSDDGRIIAGAYGYRWRNHFAPDQIESVIRMLKKDPTTRRAVLAMWDPECDLEFPVKDVPCNTHIYLRIVDECLNMTVCNRSNDLIWGALGANIVHMTFLQELIANAVGVPVGEYMVFTNNLHIYESVPNWEYYMGKLYEERDIYNGEAKIHIPVLAEGETYADFVRDCENFVQGNASGFETHWIRNVAESVYKSWGSRSDSDLKEIQDDAWRIACTEWVDRKRAAVGNQQRDNYSRVASRQQESTSLDGQPIQSSAVAPVDNHVSDVGASSSESGVNGDVLP